MGDTHLEGQRTNSRKARARKRLWEEVNLDNYGATENLFGKMFYLKKA